MADLLPLEIKRPDFDKLSKNISIQPGTECWVWNGVRDQNGYGVIDVYQRWDKHRQRSEYKRFSLHRFVYELFKRPIPKGLVINHLCENTSCCNPSHLEACTIRDNLLYSDTLARR